jgi:hypothetical protein
VYAAAFVLMIAGCGSVTGARGSASPSPPTGSEAGLALTDTDGGKTFQAHTGQAVSVTLHEPAGYGAWAGLHSTNSAVLAPVVDTRRLAVRGATLGTFRATAAGTAELQASSGASCPPLQVCPDVVRVWFVTIQVA